MPEVHVQEEPKGKKKDSKDDKYGGPILMDRDALLNEMTSGARFKKGKEKGDKSEEKVKIEGRTKDDYSRLLKNYLNGLKRVHDRAPELLQDPEHATEKAMWDIFKDQFDTNAAENNKLKGAIENFLKTPDGWAMANQALGKAAMDMANAMGKFEGSRYNRGKRGSRPDSHVVRTGDTQGILNRVGHEMVTPLITFKNSVGVVGTAIFAGVVDVF